MKVDEGMSKGVRAWRVFRVVLLGLCAVSASARALASIAVVQDNSSCPPQAVRTLAVPFTRPQVAGDLNYVAIGWVGWPRTILSVTDSKGNAYVPATIVKSGSNGYAQIAMPSGTSYADAGLAASSSNTYRVRAIDGAGNLSAAGVVTVTTPADTQTLAAPTGLQVAALSSSEVDLEWAASAAGVSAYLLERCQGASCSNFSQVAAPSGPRYADTGRASSTSYSYRVRARDAANSLSGYSSTVTTVTPASSPDCN